MKMRHFFQTFSVCRRWPVDPDSIRKKIGFRYPPLKPFRMAFVCREKHLLSGFKDTGNLSVVDIFGREEP